MSKIDDYNKFRQELRYAACWTEMLNKHYRGGGGGTGRLHSLDIKAELYYQESDGSNNYHPVPATLGHFLADEIKKDFPRLLAVAQAAMEAKRVTLAAEAHSEHAKLMEDAGLIPKASAA